jgi:hypothetical protein
MRQRMAQYSRWGKEVNFEILTKLTFGQCLDRSLLSISGVIHDHIDGAKCLHGLLDCLSDALFAGKVHFERKEVVGCLTERFRQRSCGARGRGHAVALLKQMTDELLADAFRCTSDKPGTGC